MRADFNGDGRSDLAVGVPEEDLGGSIKDAGAVNVIYGGASGLSGGNPPSNQVFTQDTTGVNSSAERGDRFGHALAADDFNGDGRSDLVVGAPFEDVFDKLDAGYVNVIYGGPGGLSAGNVPANQGFQQPRGGGANPPRDGVEAGDHFGQALAAGDFNGDGRSDLAVGAPYDNVYFSDGFTFEFTAKNCGVLNVIYGGAGGLSLSDTQKAQFFTQLEPANNHKIGSRSDEHFGRALAAGDFNGDARSDLAVGTPEEDGSVEDAGMVNVIYGGGGGLRYSNPPKEQVFTQNSAEVGDAGETGDRFAAALAAGEFNNDGQADLALGVPNEDVGSVVDAGAVNVIYGAPGGLAGKNLPSNQILSQDSPGVAGAIEKRDRFGYALAAGDFQGNGPWDLAVGVPYEHIGSLADAGAVNVIYGRSTSLTPGGLGGGTSPSNQVFTQNSPGVASPAEKGDRFGFALATGDFNGDARWDLAAGAPNEGVGGIADAGVVNTIYGAAGGLSGGNPPSNQLFNQGSPGVASPNEKGDHFGAALSSP